MSWNAGARGVALGYVVMFLGQIWPAWSHACQIAGLLVVSWYAWRMAQGVARGTWTRGRVWGASLVGVSAAMGVLVLGAYGKFLHTGGGAWIGFRAHAWMLWASAAVGVLGTGGSIVRWGGALRRVQEGS